MAYIIEKLNFNLDELRTFVLEVFKDNPETQYISLCNDIAEKLVNKSIVNNPKPPNHYGGEFKLTSYDEDRVREIIWDLVIERVVTIGINAINPTWPFIKLTEYGKKIVNSALPIPHDPSGYLSRVKSEIQNLDPIIFTYLEESIRTFNINALLSSTICLGCASEKALLLLIEAYTNAIQDEGRQNTFKNKTEGKMIKRQFEEFLKCITNLIGNMPGDIKEDLENSLTGVFTLIRNFRNDAGHPTGKVITRDVAFANLQVFISYCKKVYQLINYFRMNPL